MEFFLIYLCIINALGFLLMRADKKKAIKGQWRIPEKLLMNVAVWGGALGCLLGMYIFRHKTRHLKFTLGVPFFLLVWIVLLVAMHIL